ncbi:MAG: hypothetical protein VKK59_08045, partial [Vampirovibrionales bacterium]|nr:hypothetical protein [Vampirovibrionales bacterium]
LINDADDMTLDGQDLKILEDKYQLAMKTGGYNSQNQSLNSLGITEINLAKSNQTKRVNNFDGQNNDILKQEGANFKINGQTRIYADVIHQHKPVF